MLSLICTPRAGVASSTSRRLPAWSRTPSSPPTARPSTGWWPHQVGGAGGRAKGVTVNAICPAYVSTPLMQQQIADQAKLTGVSEAEVIEQNMLGRRPSRPLSGWKSCRLRALPVFGDLRDHNRRHPAHRRRLDGPLAGPLVRTHTTIPAAAWQCDRGEGAMTKHDRSLVCNAGPSEVLRAVGW